ncbi:MAG: hypothetical protein WA705_18720 [Candidatus Ozemobacteraceae bacterium]
MPISNQPTLTTSINGFNAPGNGLTDLVNKLQTTEFMDNLDRTVLNRSEHEEKGGVKSHPGLPF